MAGNQVNRYSFLVGLFALIAVSVRANDDLKGDRRWDFAKEAPDKITTDFRTLSSSWTAPTDDRILGTDKAARLEDATFKLILHRQTLYSDVAISARLKGTRSDIGQGSGLVWRAKNAQTYYLARFLPREQTLRVDKVVDGKRTELGITKTNGLPSTKRLRVTMNGRHIQCSFDESVALEIDDSSIRGHGRIGLWSKSDGRTDFDDLIASRCTGNRSSEIPLGVIAVETQDRVALENERVADDITSRRRTLR